jgi:hypothetical protein
MNLAQYENQQDQEWLRDLAIEQRVAEILADPQELDDAIGDVIWSGPEVVQANYARLLSRLATASVEEWARLRDEYQDLQKGIAEEYAKTSTPRPALLRRQAE